MHRLILGVTDSKIIIDHKDRDGLNNQKSNIKISTHSENGLNRRPRTEGYNLNSKMVADEGNVFYEPLKEVLESERFKEAAKADSNLRIYAGRIKKYGIKTSIAVDLLERFGYTISADKAEKISPSK